MTELEALKTQLKTVLDREADGHHLHDAIVDALEAENARLREALQLADYTLRGCNMNLRVVERKVSAALAAQAKEQTDD